MAANKTLANAVVSALFRELGEKMPLDYIGIDEETGGDIYEPIYNERLIESVVCEHQSKYPGDWQEWKHEEKLPVIKELIRKAINHKETSSARIIAL